MNHKTYKLCFLMLLLLISHQSAFGQVNAHNHGAGKMHTSAQMAIYADWTNTGTFVGNKGTVYFYGSRLQNLFGTRGMDFENIMLRNPSGLFVHVPVVVTKRMNFEAGMVQTPKHIPLMSLGFDRGAVYTNVADARHINGYCSKIGRDSFSFPVGDGAKMRTCAIRQNPNDNSVYRAAYFRGDPSVAVLPVGAPFSINQRAPDLRQVSNIEYWDVKGATPNQITLTWDADSRVNPLTNNELEKIVVAGWNGFEWRNLGNTAMSGNANRGQVRSRVLVADSFTVYTLAWGTNNFRCVASAPRFDIGNNINLCAGSSLNLNAVSQGYQFRNFLWNTGATTSNISVNQAGKYWVTVWDSCGDSQTDTLYVRLQESVKIKVDSALCYGSGSGKINVIGDTSRMSVWLNNQIWDTRGLANLPAGTYTVRLRSGKYCDLDTTVTITQPPKNRVEIGADTLQVRLNQTIVLNAKPVGNFKPIIYRWTPNDAMSCSVCQVTTAIVNRDVITYQVTAVDSAGCQTTDEVTVFTGNQRPRYAIYVPNVFKPEQEEYAVLGNPSQVKIRQMKIFDRWGELIFEARDFKPDGSVNWDGSFRGRPLNTGAFVVTVEAEFIDGTIQKIAREVTLIR